MLYNYICYFLIYSFLGWICEVAYAAIIHGRFVNRGFLNGAVCPIYGFGVCIVYAFLMPFRDTWLTLFVLSMLLTTSLELVTGFALDKLFRQRWWDYTNAPLNLGGYICAFSSVVWGLGCLFVVKLLFPLTDLLIGVVPRIAGIVVVIILMLVFAADAIVTITAMVGLNKNLKNLENLANSLKEDSNALGERVSDKAIDIKEKYEKITADGTRVSAFIDKTKDAYRELDEFGDNIAEKSREFKEDIKEEFAELRGKIADRAEDIIDMRQLKEQTVRLIGEKYSRFLKAFPNFKFNDYPEGTHDLKVWLEKMKKKK